jgi:uncharacterized protein with PIN domain
MTEVRLEDIQANTELQELTYVYTIHGTIPELMPGVAYRRVGAEEQHKRKLLKCPYCSTRLTDMDEETKIELTGHARRVPIKCQFYMRCFNCHREIGINIAR